jgi:ribose transport system substrate-binding protein
MKKGLKRLFLLSVLLLVGVFTFAGGGGETADDEGITIGYAVFNVGVDSYETYHNENFKAECERQGVDLIQLDAQGDIARQINQVENLMQKNPDVLVIWPVHGKAIVPVVKKAHDEGFKIVIANSPIDESGFDYVTAYAGPDNTQEGRDAAEMMIEAFEKRGVSGQKKVVELMGLPGYVTAIQRSDGFQEVIAQHPDFTLLATEPTDWNREKATRAMEDLLVKYKDLQGVYVADDNLGIGALNALKEAGRAGEVIMTSACIFGEGYDAMEEGYIHGTCYQYSGLDAINTVKVAVQVAKGEEVEFFSMFESPKVTPDNMEDFKRPEY